MGDEVRRNGRMLSRVADSLYWMSRNFERAQQNARILDVHLTQIVEAAGDELANQEHWRLIFNICSTEEELERLKGEDKGEDELLTYLAFDVNNPNSLYNCVCIARENARLTRDHIPNELFEIWNDTFLFARDAKKETYSRQNLKGFLRSIRMAALTTHGIIDSAMTRNIPYQIIKIGRWLERAEKTARILNVVCEKTKETLSMKITMHGSLLYVC